MEKKTTFRLANFNKLTPKKWKRIGDFFLYVIQPTLAVVAVSLPIADADKVWWLFASTVLATLTKGFTKFLTEEDV